MMKFTAALIAGFATATSAFLVPPNIPEAFKDLRFKGGPPEHVKDFLHVLLEGRTTSIDLECPGCPFAVAHDDATGTTEWEHSPEVLIHLDFATSGHTLELNGNPLFPIEEAQRAHTTTIKAHQFRVFRDADGPRHDEWREQSAQVPLNFAMEVMPAIPSPHKDGVSLIPIEFTVLGLHGRPVKVNTIALKLVQTPTGDLVIVDEKEIPFEVTPGAETCENSRAWSICRLRAIVMARLRSMVEATREKTEGVQDWVKTRCGGRRPHPHPHKHHRHGPHRYQRVSHMLHQTFRFFIIPALLGVIGGLAASAIGMVVGQTIVLLVRCYRRRQGTPRLVERQIVIVSDEKDELLAEEGLPEYEDVPQYESVSQEDTGAVSVHDEKR